MPDYTVYSINLNAYTTSATFLNSIGYGLLMSRKLIELASVPQQVPQNHLFDEVKFSETMRALKTPFKENMLEIGTETKFVRFDYESWNSIKMGFEQIACDLPFSKLILAYIQGYVILGAAPAPAMPWQDHWHQALLLHQSSSVVRLPPRAPRPY